MKEKLELKHLAPYLPYELKIKWLNQGVGYLVSCDKTNANICIEDNLFNTTLKYIKPILRPLSNLRDKDKQGEFINTNIHTIEEIERVNGGLKNLRYSTFEFLVSKHFDVFGLIEKGLAIDINTI